MHTIILAGMSNDVFTENIYNFLSKKGIKIINFTGHKGWVSESVCDTVSILPSLKNRDIASCFPNVTPILLDHETLKFFEPIRPYFNRIIDRFFLETKSNRYVEEYYNDLIAYTIAYMKKSGPISLLCSLYSPHSPMGLISYRVCAYLDIPYVFGVRTTLDAKIMFSNSFDDNISNFIEFKKSNFHYSYKNISNSDINGILSKTDWALEAGKSINKVGFPILAQKSDSGTLKSKIAHSKIVKPHLRWIKPIYDFINLVFFGKLLRNEFYGLTRFKALTLVFRNFLNVRKIKKIIRKNAVNEIKNTKYVFFPLHYQPERTTDPDGSYYTQQNLAIKLLSASIPDNFHIYVKEHPRQIKDHFDIAKLNFRDKRFYEEICKISNVSFLETNLDSNELIQNASLVACCNGSALWEALLNDIPTVSFGFCWHEYCSSTVRFKNIIETSKDIKDLLGKTKNEVNQDVKDFIMHNKDCFVPTTFGSMMANEQDFDNNKLSENFALAIMEILDYCDTKEEHRSEHGL
jgi:hypothetical protein